MLHLFIGSPLFTLKKMKIYISGKITGLPWKDSEDKFTAAKRSLMLAGVKEQNIVNPMELGIHPNTAWPKAMRICLKHLKPCNAVYMLYDWRDSFGARRELREASKQKKVIWYEEENDILSIAGAIQQGTLW